MLRLKMLSSIIATAGCIAILLIAYWKKPPSQSMLDQGFFVSLCICWLPWFAISSVHYFLLLRKKRVLR